MRNLPLHELHVPSYLQGMRLAYSAAILELDKLMSMEYPTPKDYLECRNSIVNSRNTECGDLEHIETRVDEMLNVCKTDAHMQTDIFDDNVGL